jgi:hypothetical protein
MNPQLFAERIWYQCHVPVFLEKFLLPVLVTVGSAILVVNPMKFDWQSRISLFVGLLAIGYFVSHQLHLRNEALRAGTPPPSSSASPIQISGPASTSGDQSPAITGDGNKTQYSKPVKEEPSDDKK